MSGATQLPVIEVAAAVLQRSQPVETLAVRKAGGENAGRWEFPGGKLEPHESLPQCLRRELHEELNINASIGPWVGTSEYQTSSLLIRLHAYLVFDWHGTITLTEHDALAWLTVDKLIGVDWAPADIPLVQCVIERQADSANR